MSPPPDLMTRPVGSDRFLVFHTDAFGRLTSGRLTWDKLVATVGMDLGVGTLGEAIAAEVKARDTADRSLADRLTALEKATSDLSARVKAVEDAALRIEIVSGAVTTAGTAVAITFAKAFAAVPALVAVPGWAGEQMIEATATEVTKAGAKIVVKRSRGTLVLTSGPFENAPASTPFTMLAIGR